MPMYFDLLGVNNITSKTRSIGSSCFDTATLLLNEPKKGRNFLELLICCNTCSTRLHSWLKGKRHLGLFIVSLKSKELTNHMIDCFVRPRKARLRPVPHGEALPIPELLSE